MRFAISRPALHDSNDDGVSAFGRARAVKARLELN
jgi:hypothetical protein